jgi:hypothetical protein
VRCECSGSFGLAYGYCMYDVRPRLISPPGEVIGPALKPLDIL